MSPTTYAPLWKASIYRGPSFSIVIPTYNRASLIGKTLQSVFSQTYANYEVIVVDNCSTDNTLDVLRPYIRAGQLRFIKHDCNYGRAQSRNTGLDHAAGDFVTFLDSDDLMYPNNLKEAAAYIGAHPTTRCFHNLYELVDERNNLIHRYRFPPLGNRLRAIAEGNFPSCIGVFIHREIYTHYRFDLDPLLCGSEDWDFWLRVLADHNIGRIPSINSGIVQHNGRTVNQQRLEQVQVRMERILAKVTADQHLSSVYGDYMPFMKASRYIFTAGVANGNGEHRKAVRLLWEAALIDGSCLFNYRFVRTLQIALWKWNRRAWVAVA